MPPRPATGSQRKATLTTSNQPLQGKLRPHSAALLVTEIPTRSAAATKGSNGERVGATSDELIRDLEHKVRKVVELKRAKSDKLRFAVTKKREDVDKAKLVLQDLIKDSEALGVHYHPNNQTEDKSDDKIVEEPNRLQPIVSISRRPVYSKHTKINELETKLEKRAQASHDILRSTVVLEHIKKRLLNERIELTQETNQLKAKFAELDHQTQELQKKDIAASEAVSQVQTRVTQQKDEMETNLRKYKREVEMRQKWAREKAKFEKYYDDQMQTLLESTGQNSSARSPEDKKGSPLKRGDRSTSPSRIRRQSVGVVDDQETQEEYRQAFLRMGFGHHTDGVDPEEIIRVCLSHEQIMKELDEKHAEDMERIALLRDQLAHSRSIATEKIPLSKRGTSQRLETKEIEISSVERALATVVDQYMFVDQSVRPLKIGLQHILQNVTNETVNVDDTAGMEKALLDSIEEMMKLVRKNQDDTQSESNQSPTEDNPSHLDSEPGSIDEPHYNTTAGIQTKSGVVSAENFTSPYNIRIPPKPKEPYYVLGVNVALQPAKQQDEGEADDLDFDVMDRSTVKRISSVLVCTSTGKKTKDERGGYFN